MSSKAQRRARQRARANRPALALTGPAGPGYDAKAADEATYNAEVETELAIADSDVKVTDADLARGERLIEPGCEAPPGGEWHGYRPEPVQVVIMTVLDEVDEFHGRFADMKLTQRHAITCWIAATHVLECFPAFPHLLITGDKGSGKSEELARVRDLSRNGWNAKGTAYALRAKLAEPNRPTMCVDEISDVFGKSGRQNSGSPLGTLLRLGYKCDATDSFASAHAVEEVSIYAAAAMAGRGVAVPDDIRDRSVHIAMAQGHPDEDYLVREHAEQARMYRAALGQWARTNARVMQDFRAKGLHPRLVGRRREVWEPLFAVAAAAGGPWPRRILSAYLDLALDEADIPPLTPKQAVIRDVQAAAGRLGGERIAGADIITELRDMGEALYEGMNDRALAMFIASALDPVRPDQFRLPGGKPVRGYYVADIERIAAARLPKPPVDETDSTEDDDDSGTLFDVSPDEDIWATV